MRVDTVELRPEGRTVHLRGYGWVKVLRTVSPNGDVEHWASSDLDLTPERQEVLQGQAWGIEQYHRGLQ